MRFACSTASFPSDRLQVAVAKIGWAGFQAVELSLAEDVLPSLTDLPSHLQANELELVAIHAGVLPGEAGEAGVEGLARVGRAAELARRLDCSLVVAQAPAEGTAEGLARALKMLDGALGQVSVDICVTNRARTALDTHERLRALWDCGLPERVGLALDPGQALLAGWDPTVLEALPEFPRHVYLNDAGAGRIVPPGEGELDLPRLGAALRLQGYGGAVSLVLENADPWAVDPVARESRAAAETWFGG